MEHLDVLITLLFLKEYSIGVQFLHLFFIRVFTTNNISPQLMGILAYTLVKEL